MIEYRLTKIFESSYLNILVVTSVTLDILSGEMQKVVRSIIEPAYSSKKYQNEKIHRQLIKKETGFNLVEIVFSTILPPKLSWRQYVLQRWGQVEYSSFL